MLFADKAHHLFGEQLQGLILLQKAEKEHRAEQGQEQTAGETAQDGLGADTADLAQNQGKSETGQADIDVADKT